MTRCKEFYDRWCREENWCDHCSSAVSDINSYLRMVEALEKNGIKREFAYANFSEGAARPIFREGDTDVKDGAFGRVLDFLELQQKREKLGNVPDKITSKQVAAIVQEAKTGKTLREPKSKRVDPANERIPLWSVTAWLRENTTKYIDGWDEYTKSRIDLEQLVEDLEKEMRKRHLGR